MQKLKIALSVLALVVIGAAGVTSFGSWQVPPAVSEVLAASGVLLAWLGYQPIAVPVQVSRICAALSVAASGFVTSHATAWGDGHKHIALIVVCFVAALLGALARGPVPRQVDPTPPAQK